MESNLKEKEKQAEKKCMEKKKKNKKEIKRTRYWYDNPAEAERIRQDSSRRINSLLDSSSSQDSSSDEGHKRASQKLCRIRKDSSRRTNSLSDMTSSQDSSSDEGHKRASQKLCRSVSLKSRSHSTHHCYGNREQMSTKEMTCSKKITESYISKPGPSFNVDSDFAGYPASREMKRQWIKEFSKFNSESATYTERDAFTHSNFNESDSNSEGENDMLHRSHRYSPKIKSRIQKQHSSYNMASISSSDHKSYASNSVSKNSYTYKSSVIMEMEKKSSKSNYERYRSRSPRSHSKDRSNRYRTSSSCHCCYETSSSRQNSYSTSYSRRTNYASSHQNYKHTHKD